MLIHNPKLFALVLSASTFTRAFLACSTDAPQPSKGIVEADLVAPGAGKGSCPNSGSWLQIGNFARPDKPETAPIQDGQTQNAKSVQIVCSVKPAGDKFDFTSDALLQGEGSVNLSGVVSKTGTSKVRAFFNRSDVGRFTQDDCDFEPYHPGGEYDGAEKDAEGKPKKLPDVAAGRIWGKVTCNSATRSDQDPPRVCLARVSFRFENCSQ
jgi:hypothetical protein